MRVTAQRGAEDLIGFPPGGGGHTGIAAKGDAVAVVGDAGSTRHSTRSRCSGQQADDLGAGVRQRFPACLAPGGVPSARPKVALSIRREARLHSTPKADSGTVPPAAVYWS